MRITIDHRTRYAFSEPQLRLVQALRLSPDDTNDQTIVSWRIDVDCDARLREARDGLGNKLTMLYADGPLESIEISVQGEVLTAGADGFVHGTAEPLPPAFYLRETERTRAGEALSAFVLAAVGEGGTAGIDAAVRAMHDRFTMAEDSHDPLRDAEAAFSDDRATGRELAQMLVAGLRSARVPARYVSGYRQAQSERCSPHGWVEAHLPDLGWMGIDPSVGARIDERYVRVAVGLDAGDATPVAGSRLGPGEEELDVALRVAVVGGNA
ncbi:transglutaminase family protein [Sphingomonas qomolangmaensis]|uniref:Transglutaminase family protein n=1 Tax=Sphingomonas qomolangmaensis TaxID=2918765 RepID=A0ABY5LEK0_9SPHN|nr:transglutaminase family protein [Sphingomonas qomolangmaensis]UUL84123.1 transglutaminase family protein [Sphingomonas qomolangmaensis]